MEPSVIQKFAELREYVRNYINDNAIYRVAPWEKPIPGKAKGSTYIWQFYTRRATYNPVISHAISIMFWLLFEEEFIKTPFQIGGCETAGTPIVTSIMNVGFDMGYSINTFVMKKERKAYGLYNFSEGIIDSNLPVLLVDDVAASQITLVQNQYQLEKSGYKIYDKYFTLVNKRSSKCEGHPESLLNRTLVSLFTTEDFDLTYNEYLSTHDNNPPPFRYNF